MSGWRFSAILPTSSLYSTSSFWTTVVRIVQLSAVLKGTSLFAPAAFFPGCGHENLRCSSLTPPGLRCLLTLLLTQIIPTYISFIFICIDGYLYDYLQNNSDIFLGNAVHKVEKKYHLFLHYWCGGTRRKLQFLDFISATWHVFCFKDHSKGLKIQDITNSYYPIPCDSLTLLHSELSAKAKGERR